MARKLYSATKIRAWRLHRGLTQAELAEQMSLHMQITEATISRVENGKQPYNQQMLEVLALVLKTDPPSLISRAPDDVPPIAALWSRANDSQRRQINAVAEAIVGFDDSGQAGVSGQTGEDDEMPTVPRDD